MKKFVPILLSLMLMSACQANRAQNSAMLGSLVGASAGALTFKNKISGAAIGAGAGMLAGYIIGNEMDKYDEQQVSQVLETTPSGRETIWVNPDTHARYKATPKPPRREKNGRIVRDITLQGRMPNGKKETIHAHAYRSPNGTWHLIQ